MFRSFRRSRERKIAGRLYAAVVAQARKPALFDAFAVPDTVDGRFDMVALHVFLLLRRLGREGEAGRCLAQAVFDAMFVDMDENLRELGVGDLAVGPRVKAMAKAFYGRIAAYEAGLEEDAGAALEDALRRNVYRGRENGCARALAAYLRRQDAILKTFPAARILAGEVVFDDGSAEGEGAA